MNAISRWEPFSNLFSSQDQFRKFIESVLPSRGESSLTTWAPPVDIYETEDALVIKADLPDVNEKDLDVRVENNMLTIHGERKIDETIKEGNYLRTERYYGSFNRSFSLPNTVNTDDIHAEYSNGVLTVRLAKRAESKPKQVKVNVAASGAAAAAGAGR